MKQKMPKTKGKAILKYIDLKYCHGNLLHLGTYLEEITDEEFDSAIAGSQMNWSPRLDVASPSTQSTLEAFS